MTDTSLPHGQLPPIPEGCGILPVAENRIAFGPHPELLDALPDGYEYPSSAAVSAQPLNDAMEQMYRRVLARALALAACALLLAAAVSASLIGNTGIDQSSVTLRVLVRAIFVGQILIGAFCSRFVEKLPILPAAVLLFSYASFCAMEFSALLHPGILAIAFLCAALMYASTAIWGFSFGADLAHPLVPAFMIVAGGVILVAVNLLSHSSPATWTVSSLVVVIFAGLVAYYAQQIRDFYQDFDDDNAQGWKASVLGALLLLVNSVNLLILAATFLSRRDDDGDCTDNLPR
jgi:hypothetical protein